MFLDAMWDDLRPILNNANPYVQLVLVIFITSHLVKTLAQTFRGSKEDDPLARSGLLDFFSWLLPQFDWAHNGSKRIHDAFNRVWHSDTILRILD